MEHYINSPKIHPYIHGQFIFVKVPRQLYSQKIIISTNGAGITICKIYIR